MAKPVSASITYGPTPKNASQTCILSCKPRPENPSETTYSPKPDTAPQFAAPAGAEVRQ